MLSWVTQPGINIDQDRKEIVNKSLKKNLRIDEAAEILNTSPRTIYRLIAEGELIAFKVRSSLRIPQEGLDMYQARQIQKFQEENEFFCDRT